MKLDDTDTDLEPDGPMKVRKLGFWFFGDWHVVQDFSISLDPGEYVLVGTTNLIREDSTRTNTVNLTIR